MQSSDISLRKDQDYDINIVNINYNSMDFNALIGIVDIGLVSDYWFYLQDTCYVADYFYERIQKIEDFKDYIPWYAVRIVLGRHRHAS